MKITKLIIITAQSGIPVLNPTQLLKLNPTNQNKSEKSLQEAVNFQQKENELQRAPVNTTTDARYLYQSLNPQVESRAHSSGYFPAQHVNNQKENMKRADKTALTTSQCPIQQAYNAQKLFELSKVQRK